MRISLLPCCIMIPSRPFLWIITLIGVTISCPFTPLAVNDCGVALALDTYCPLTTPIQPNIKILLHASCDATTSQGVMQRQDVEVLLLSMFSISGMNQD